METSLLALIAVVLSLWFLWRKRKFSKFKKLNIPGPEPSLFFGNIWELYWKGEHNSIKKWINQYGRVFGYYFGTRPVLVVADLDMIRIIQQKEFHKFANRPNIFEVGKSTTDFNKYSITTAKGKKWKDLRSIITPTFTTSKLKMMSSIMAECARELLGAVEKESVNGKVFDMYKLYQNLTMDVIARTAMGVYSKAQTDKNEPLVKLARVIFAFRMTFLGVLTFSFTEFMFVFSLIRRVLMSWRNEGRNPRAELQEKTASAIKMRRNDQNTRRRDALQLLMDAQRTEENVNDSSLTASENDDNIPSAEAKQGASKNKVIKLSDEEVLHNAVVFLLAGYETTSTALAFTTHFLVKHQDVQDKLREEIREHVKDINDVSYELVHKLPYLDRVIHEALRCHPPVTYFVNRQALEDTVIEGVHIPKNVAVQIPVYFLHHDPTIWENPEKFDPDRFTPEAKANRHPMAFQAFGSGSRNCVGLRFALTEMKLALTELLFCYKLLPKSGNTEEDLDVYTATVIDRPASGIFLRAEKV